MNVCMLSSRFYPIIGGAEQQAQRLARSLRGRGIHASVVTCRYRDLAADEILEGVPVHRINTIYRGMEPRGKTASLHMMAVLLRHLVRIRDQIDIIHVHGAGKMAMTANVAKQFIKKPVVVKVATASTRGTGEGDLYGAETAPLGSLRLSLLKRCDTFIATSQQIVRELTARGVPERRVVLIPNGVDTQRFTPAGADERIVLREKLGIRGRTACLFLGRLIRRKGVDLLLEAWREVIRDVPDATLVVAGSGVEEKNLKKMTQTLGLGTSVSFHGAIDPVELETYFRAADLFVLPSRCEGMPNVLLEAMSCGIPVVATSIGGIIDVITDGENGLLVPPDDREALAASIKQILAHGDTALGVRGRISVVERFSLGAVTDRYIDLYEKLTKIRPSQ